MNEARVSVCIPTYDRKGQLERALNSVLMQRFKNIDIVIVDNNSDEDTWGFIKNLKEKYTDIRIYRNEKNLGFAGNWNKCIEYALGRYINLLHSDDELMPGMLEKTVNFLEEHGSVGLVHTNGLDCLDDGRCKLRRTQDVPVLEKGYRALEKCMTNHNFICSSVVVRRECYREGFLLDNPSPDAEMYARIARDYDMGHIDEPLVRCYIHDDSAGSRYLLEVEPEKIETQWLDLGKIVVSYFPETCQGEAASKMRRSMANGLWAAGAIAWREGDIGRAHLFFKKTLKYIGIVDLFRRYVIQLLKMIKFKITTRSGGDKDDKRRKD